MNDYPEGGSSPRRPPPRRKVASGYIKENHGIDIAPQTMARMAVEGGAAPFRKFGRYPYYDPEDLDRWVMSRLGNRQRSTSDNAGGA